MSSIAPPDGGNSKSSGNPENPHSRPSAQRGSSWIERMHKKRHDKKQRNHADEPEAAPLLAEDGQEEDDDSESQDESEPESPVRRASKKAEDFYQFVTGGISRLFTLSRDFVSKNWKYAVVAMILAGLTTLIGLVISAFVKHRYSILPAATCTSAACVHAASGILYNLDPEYEKLDPCTDFDQYVCGGWDERHDLRPDQGDLFTGNLMSETSQMILRHILESPNDAESPADRENLEKLKAGYEACIDEQRIKERGLKPMKAVLERIAEIFPVSSSNKQFFRMAAGEQHGLMYRRENQLTSALVYLMDLGISAFVTFDIEPDDRDPDTIAIYVRPPGVIGLPNKEYYNNAKTLADYRTMASTVMANILGTDFGNVSTTWNLGGSSTKLNVENLVKSIVDLEVKLAAITPPEEDQEDVTKYYNPRTIAETTALLPQVSFESLIASQAPSDFELSGLIVAFPTYMKSLSDLLVATPKDVVQGFLLWKAIQDYADKIEDPSVEPLLRFENVLRGKEPDAREERWRTCITYVDYGLGWILSKFFVESAFSEQSKRFGDRIVSDIKESFVTTLENTDWMTKEVRDLGIDKVHNIVQKIGYPTSNPDILDPKALQLFYKDLDISNSTFFDNTIRIARFDTRREWARLGKPTQRDEWYMTTPTVNAYYSPPGNEIVFPAGIMQPPVFYPPNVPQYLSYGAFGAVSGHELSHAFDSTGRHYDQTGNYTDWWDNSTIKAFEAKAQCFIEQYSKFSVEGPDGKPLHVNGRLTLGENIADAGGLRASFQAWQRHDREEPNEHLPGLDLFTKEQLFFISYSNWWCGKSTKAKAIERIYTDPHAPKWSRILGTMANSREFREAFNCPSKEPTCELW